MAVPTSREEFKQYCLRKLGKPVIEINVDDDQVEDRIDEALKYYWDYHFDGVEKTYYKYQVLETDYNNKYITLPDNILGATNIFNPSTAFGIGDMFNIRYQIALNDLYTLTSVSVVPYYLARTHLNVLAEMLVGTQPIRFNRNMHRLYIDADWTMMPAGTWLVVEAYQIVDPDTYTDTWGERWLGRYATALIKKQWGSNLTKFTGMQLPGGVMFNGEKIFNDASAELDQLEHEMIHSYSLPNSDMYG